MADLGDRAQVVIVGGGIVGCSIAYHLTRRGVTDVLLIEQGQLTSGTTWHAAGLVSQLKSSHSLTRLATYSAQLFEELEAETGQATGYRAPGSISVAADEERWEELLRGMSMARTVGVDIRQIDLDEALELCPLLNIDDLVGALFIPRDGVTSPVDTTMALAKGARAAGARIVQGTAVTGVVVEDGRAVGVDTEAGRVEAETVVLAAGIWTRQLAATAGVSVPVQACEHFYIVTEPVEGAYPNMPTVRDPSNYTYFKEETGKLMAGFFEPRGKVWNLDGIPRDLQFKTLPEDWEHVGPIFERAIHRMPVLGEAGLQLFFNGPEAFTPDGVYYLGESPEVDRCFVAAGFNSVGIQSAGGVGWVLADWIVDDHPPMDLSMVDIRRSFGFQCEPAYLDARIPESLGLLYAMHWPFRQYETARNIRRSPLHERIDAAGAVFGEVGGWERPNWYAAPGQEREYRYSWGPQNWFEASEVECDAVRNAVGLFDQTSFAKFTVEGPDAMAPAQLGVRQRGGRASGAGGVYPVAQRLRRHRSRPHRDPPGGELLLGGHLGRHRHPRLGLAAAGRSGSRRGHRRRYRPLRRAGRDGTQLPGRAEPALRRRSRQRRLPVRHRPGSAYRRGGGLGAAHDLRGRAGLGALCAQRTRSGSARCGGGRGNALGIAPRRLSRHEHAAHGGGLLPLGPRHHR